jgi:N-glycosylase/DNA lyase
MDKKNKMSLIEKINELKNSGVAETIEQRIGEFEAVRNNGQNEVFRELCYVILTAGTSAELGMKTIAHLGDTIFTGTEQEILEKLREVYRFYNKRAPYLRSARDKFYEINLDSENVREQIAEKIDGIGLKAASQFLRNIGFKDYAIIDFHIVDVLTEYRLIEPLKSKSLTPKKYIEIENVLRELAEQTDLDLARLDLYLWYMETDKVMK